MNLQTFDELRRKTCVPCSGAVPASSPQDVERQLRELVGWQASPDRRRIFKTWIAKDFTAAMDFLNEVARVAEAEDHHPDLHLEDYRHVRIELSTHAIGGLSENDFIVAAKIDLLPLAVKE